METSLKLLELACFFDLNKVYLPTYLLEEQCLQDPFICGEY